jgi:DNA polymerase III alpha subunit
LTLRRRPNDSLRLYELSNMAARAHVPTVVTNNVLLHVPARRILQDIVTCIRHNCTIDEAGFRRERHADRHLKPPEGMARPLLAAAAPRQPHLLRPRQPSAVWPNPSPVRSGHRGSMSR